MAADRCDAVSVVIPTRNRVAELRRAILSVLAQSRQPDEVIVVDDGSENDPAPWLTAEFPQVRLIRQPHRGVSTARNRGIDAARSTWIAFLDSDDEWLPHKLARQIAALQENPRYSICHSDEVWIRRGRRVNPKHRHAKAGGFIFRRCLELCVISPSSVLVHRPLLNDVGRFDETLPVCEDYDLWLRICCDHPVLFVDEPLVVKYGGHADQLSRRYWGMDRFRIRALEKSLGSGRLSPGDHQAALRALRQKISIYVQGARRRGKLREVEAYEAMERRYAQPSLLGEQQWRKSTG